MAEEIPLETRNFFPALKRNTTPTTSGSRVVSYSSDLGDNGPILVLIHGYPRSAFLWRHLTPHLLPRVSLFIPELPGYGVSSPPTASNDYSRKNIGTALLESLALVFSISPSSGPGSHPRKIILAGHDRGARISHRLVVNRSEFLSSLHLEIISTILLDIVPTKAQWDSFANPTISQAYFHWPLLANVDLATQLIKSVGGGNWTRMALRLAGNGEGLARIQSDGAVDVYAGLFDKEETIRGTCEDYRAGAQREYDEQVEDQKAGRKISLPTLVMYSMVGIGSRTDVAGEWKNWVSEEELLEAVGVEGYGHYLPEEAWDVVLEKMLTFLGKFA